VLLVTSPSQRQLWTNFLNILPPIPTGEKNGQEVLLPAKSTQGNPRNSENTPLYSVFPYRVFTIGREGLDTAVNTYKTRQFPCNDGWCQDVIDAALLGLTSEAERQILARAKVSS